MASCRGRWRQPRGWAAAVVAVLAAGGADAEEAADAGEDKNPQSPLEARKFTSDWLEDDPVEVYYGEFLLAQWILERAPWNAYHSGLGFVNNRTQRKVVFDYSPEDTSSVMNMVVPDVQFDSKWRALVLGEARLVWRDASRTQFFPYWPASYSSFVRVGRLNGSVFHAYADWVASNYTPRFDGFQPIEIATALGPGTGGAANTAAPGGHQHRGHKAKTLLRSRMCHDFVTDSLWVLYENGVALGAQEPILRDHIIMYAEEATAIGRLPESGRKVRQWLRYLRLLGLFLEEIKQQFTAAREALVVNWRLGLSVFLHDASGDYDVKLVPPFLNYCYLPLAMPPEVHDPMGAMKLCALGMEVNLTNVTVPMPWGAALAVEEQLDQEYVVPALALVILAAVVAPRISSRGAAAETAAKKDQ